MEIQKKPMNKYGLALLSSLSESYTLLPFMIFSSLLSGEAATVNFFVPVVILYSIERACIIGLRGFGEINNPYRIMRDGLIMALVGAVLMISYVIFKPLLMFSALLVGVGLAPLRAMFIPLYSSLIEKDPTLKKGKSMGMVIYLLIMTLVLTVGKTGPGRLIVPVFFLLYIAAILFIVLRLDGDELFKGRKAFDSKKKSPAFFVFGILALLSLIILRQYQMSGVSVLMWMTPFAVIIFFAIEIYRRRGYKDYSFQAYWAGGMKSFIMLYSLVYNTTIGNTSIAMLVYLALAISSFASDIVRGMMKRHLSGNAISNVSLFASAILAFLLTIPSEIVTIIGIILCSTFANILIAEVGDNYMKDERYVKEERALVKIRLLTAGSIMEQLVLFFTIYILGETGIHQNLLEPYVSKTPNLELSFLLRSSGFVCCGILLIVAILIVCVAGKRRKK